MDAVFRVFPGWTEMSTPHAHEKSGLLARVKSRSLCVFYECSPSREGGGQMCPCVQEGTTMKMSETDPVLEAIEQGWEVILNMEDETSSVTIVAATEAYLAVEYVGGDGDTWLYPWDRVLALRFPLGAKRAL